MSRIYTNTNRIKFTDISEKYKVNRAYKGKLSELHALVITYVVNNFRNSKKYKEKVVYALNVITYSVYAEERLPFEWSSKSPLVNIPDIDVELIEETLGDILLTVDSIEWDVKPTSNIEYEDIENATDKISSSNLENKKANQKQESSNFFIPQDNSIGAKISEYGRSNNISDVNKLSNRTASIIISPTPKQDLYIQPPTIPQFDHNRPWLREFDGVDNLVIYTTLPEIPTKQNQISVTTDVTKMRYDELMKLYPNCNIHTRASVMYEPLEGVDLDPDIGLIIPIEGFTKDQIIDNIIRYPHIFKLVREVDSKHYSFYSHIEIDGELKGTLDVWDSLPEAKILPRQAEFVKEYVVRRYLLERDINKIEHKYPVFGTFDQFLTLFMPSDDYIRRGYTNVEEIAKQCVLSRVSYKQSRNPVIRRLSNV